MAPLNPWLALAERAAEQINAVAFGPDHTIAIVLGSGWGEAVEKLGTVRFRMEMTQLPGFMAPTVGSHAGEIVSLDTGRRRLLVFRGRTHLNEDVDVHQVVHSVRTAARVGCTSIILTNAAGTLRREWPIGKIVAIRDHLNLTNASPALDHVSMNEAYSLRLREICCEVEPGMPTGVYAQVRGKQYETPAEIRMLRTLGADLVGMSTALETIAARELNLEVLGLSLVTNFGAGMVPNPPSHAEVMDVGRSNAGRLGRFLNKIIARM